MCTWKHVFHTASKTRILIQYCRRGLRLLLGAWTFLVKSLFISSNRTQSIIQWRPPDLLKCVNLWAICLSQYSETALYSVYCEITVTVKYCPQKSSLSGLESVQIIFAKKGAKQIDLVKLKLMYSTGGFQMA